MGVQIKEMPGGKHIVYVCHRGCRLNRTCPNYAVAEELSKLFIKQLATDPEAIFRKPEPMKPTFRQMAKKWMRRIEKKVAQGKARQTTYNRYSQLLNDYVLPHVGSRKVDEIKKYHIIDAIEQVENAGLSVSTMGLIRTCFRAPLQIAVVRDFIPSNPADSILEDMGISRKDERQRKLTKEKFLTPEQTWAFLTACEKHFPDYHPFFQFLFMTGTRVGEALAVTWEDVNWKTKAVQINKAFRTTLGKTKTGTEREIDLPDVLVETLKNHRLEIKKQALKNGLRASDLVFPHKGRHMRQNQARRIFKRILAKAELPEHRLHDTRHSYAALMLKNGSSLDYVRRMLGHSDIGMTSNTYGHLMPNRDRSQVNELGTILSTPPTKHAYPRISENTKAVTP